MNTLLRSVLAAAVLVTISLPARPSEAASGWRAALQNARRNATLALERSLEAVEATPKQRTRIRQILAGAATEAWSMRGDALRLQDQLAAALLAADPDETELDQLEVEGVELIGRGVHLTRVTVARAAAVLNPSQRAEVLTMWRRWVKQVAGS